MQRTHELRKSTQEEVNLFPTPVSLTFQSSVQFPSWNTGERLTQQREHTTISPQLPRGGRRPAPGVGPIAPVGL